MSQLFERKKFNSYDVTSGQPQITKLKSSQDVSRPFITFRIAVEMTCVEMTWLSFPTQQSNITDYSSYIHCSDIRS